jgi:hypothetical protein
MAHGVSQAMYIRLKLAAHALPIGVGHGTQLVLGKSAVAVRAANLLIDGGRLGIHNRDCSAARCISVCDEPSALARRDCHE